MATSTLKPKQPGLRQNEKKWTKTLLDAGWSIIPNVILDRQSALGLDAIDINILLHLVRHWWYSDKLPYPSKRIIAECMGIHESTVRKRIARLEAAKLIKRNARFDPVFGQQSNEYDLTGLINEALPFAQEAVETRKARKAEDAGRRKRKRPILKVARD